MRVSIICSNATHPIVPHLETWKVEQENCGHQIDILSQSGHLESGDILFLVSCSEKITQQVRDRFKHVFVLHASDLPKGRGWSPYIWDILSGKNEIVLSLIDAQNQIDTGKVWQKIHIPIPSNFLYDEVNRALFHGEVSLMSWAIENYKTVTPVEQNYNVEPTYWPRRTAEDSRLDPNKTLAEQFDLLRLCDPNRYPAFLEINGRKYKLTLDRFDEKTN